VTRLKAKLGHGNSKNASICARLSELRKAVTASVLQIAITERDQRLLALQDMWDRVRAAIVARSGSGYSRQCIGNKHKDFDNVSNSVSERTVARLWRGMAAHFSRTGLKL